MSEQDIRHREKKLIYEKGNQVPLYIFGDTHIGHVGTDKELLKSHIKMAKEDDAYWVHMGDIVDAVMVDDKRYDIRNIDRSLLTLKEQYDYSRELFSQLDKDKCLGILTGNHDDKIRDATNIGYDFAMLFANQLDVPYIGYSGYMTIHFENQHKDRWGQTLLLWHGQGGGRRPGGKINRVEELVIGYDADLYIVGHFHQMSTVPKGRFYHSTNGRHNKIMKKDIWLITTGGYLEGHLAHVETYVSRKMYNPAKLGCVRIVFDPDNKRVFATAI